MDIKEIIKMVENPKPYDKGKDIMWTDKHISKCLLELHINPDVGSASRTSEDIDKTVDMIDQLIKPESRILDLGCGPGLYTERLARKKHKVTGCSRHSNLSD